MEGGFPVFVASILRRWLAVNTDDEREWLWPAIDDVMDMLWSVHRYHLLFQVWCLELRDCLRFLVEGGRWMMHPNLLEELVNAFVFSMIDELDFRQCMSIFETDVSCAPMA